MTRKIIKKLPETLIVKATENVFATENARAEVKREVQFCERIIDIYVRYKSPLKYVAVEAKVNAVSRAFAQAMRYRHVANYVYVAMQANKSNSTAIRLAKQTGIGLVLVEKIGSRKATAKILIKPLRSTACNQKIAKYLWEQTSRHKVLTGQ